MKKTFGMLMMGFLSLSLLVSMPTFAQEAIEEIQDVGGYSLTVEDPDATINMVVYRATAGYTVSYTNDFTFESSATDVDNFVCTNYIDNSYAIKTPDAKETDLTVSNRRLWKLVNNDYIMRNIYFTGAGIS